MAIYDLEEQEQISALKTWWRMYGNLVSAVLLALAVGMAGWQGWAWYQRQQAAAAARLYAALQKAVSENDAKRVREAAGELTEKYPRTAYAALAALTSARLHFAAGDLASARVQLQWVAEKARDKDLQALARLRLAHVLLDQNATAEALALLAEVPTPAFAARYGELRGDILALQGKSAEARAAYQEAIAKLQRSEAAGGEAALGGRTQYQDLLQAKLEALGGK